MFTRENKACLLFFSAILLFLPILKCTDIFQRGLARSQCFNKTYKHCRINTSHLSITPVNGIRPETYFYLFTPDNPEKPEFLHECALRLSSTSNFKPSYPTEIFIHGWLEGICTLAVFREMKDQVLIKGQYNVILVDWTWGNQGDYYDAVKNLKVLALQVATLIKNIMHQRGVSRTSFHIVGHSLGAQAAGLVGNYLKVGRITGLEPAGPGFREDYPLNQRLDPSDADLVDVIHTNMGSCLPFFGNNYQTGDADFIINGGQFQETCHITMLTSLVKGDLLYAGLLGIPSFCSHLQALEYYKVSINPGNCQYIGIDCQDYADFESGQCDSCQDSLCAVMGMDFKNYITADVRRAFPVTFYLDADILCPYCSNAHLNLNGFFNFSSDGEQMCGLK